MILVVDPLVGLVAGLSWFGETVDLGTDAVVCAIVLLAGVVVTQRGARHTGPARTTPARGRRTSRRPGERACERTSVIALREACDRARGSAVSGRGRASQERAGMSTTERRTAATARG